MPSLRLIKRRFLALVLLASILIERLWRPFPKGAFVILLL